MSAIPLSWYLALAAALFVAGVFGVVTRRNAVGVLMGVELMLNAANINLVAFWRYLRPGVMEGPVFVLLVITVAAAEAAVGLAIVLSVYRNFQGIELEQLELMKH